MHLAHTSTEKMSCSFLTLVIRNDSLNRLYAGGLKGFMVNNPSRCNEDIAVDCYMDDEIDDTVRDLVANGLVQGDDFVFFDAARLTMFYEPTAKRESLDTGTPWLRAMLSGGEVFVWYDHTYPSDSF